MPLTPLQQRFVEEMAIDPSSATRAYRRAGGRGKDGSSARQQAARLMAHGGVRAAIAEARAERARAMRIDALWVCQRLVTVVQRCMQIEAIYDGSGEATGVFRFDPKGAVAALKVLREMVPPPERQRSPEEIRLSLLMNGI